MKILMISPQPFFTPRGTPFSVYHRCRALASLGHAIDLITYPIGRDVAIPGVTIMRMMKVPFITSVGIGPSVKKLILDFFLFWKGFGLLLFRRYDFVHAHEEAVFFCLIYKLFFWRLKILYDMHSSLPQQLRNFDYSKNSVLIGIFSALEIWAIRWSKAVITICPELEKLVDDLDLKTPQVMIENSMCDPVDFSDMRDAFSEDFIDWGKFEGKKLVLYTGTFEYYQGIPMLLEAAKNVKEVREDVTFVLIGGAPHQIIEMRKLSKKMGLEKSAVFTGNLHPNTVKMFISRADILVSPRQKGNNTPLKIYEYLASGKPIVATDHHTHTQIMTKAHAAIAYPNSISFAAEIVRVLNHPEEAEKIGSGAAGLYDSRYGRKSYLEKLEKIILYFGRPPAAPRLDAVQPEKRESLR